MSDEPQARQAIGIAGPKDGSPGVGLPRAWPGKVRCSVISGAPQEQHHSPPCDERNLMLTSSRAQCGTLISSHSLELDTIHRLCVAFHTVDEDAFGEAASIGTLFSGTPYRQAGSAGGARST